MSNIKIFTFVLLAAAVTGAANAYAGPGGGGGHGGGYYGGGRMPYGMDGSRYDRGGMPMRGTPYSNGPARYAGRPAGSYSAVHSNSGGQHSAAGHGRPDFDGHRDGRSSGIHHAPTLGSDRFANLRSNTRRSALRTSAGAPNSAANVRFPNARAQIVGNPATVGSPVTAGSHDSRGGHGWWRHRNGGFGWVGPVFWPYAYDDIYDYTLWGYGYDDPFWDYGYGEIYAGMFAPDGNDDRAGFRPRRVGSVGGPQVQARPHGVANARPAVETQPQNTVQTAVNVPPRGAVSAQPKGIVNARTDNARTDDKPTTQPPDAADPRIRDAQAAAPTPMAQMCGEDSRDIAGLPIDQIQAAVTPTAVQRGALDDLANASLKAAETIRTACPTEVALTAPGRLAAMEQRIEAMISAVDMIQPALRTFNDLLNDEQKTRMNALGTDQRPAARTAKNKNNAFAGTCDAGQAKVPPLPIAEIEAKIHPTDVQRKGLAALRDATARAANMLNIACPTNAGIITPVTRLEAVRQRLVLTQQAITIVLAALDDFYGQLSEDQKQQFEAIGQRLPAATDQPGAARSRGRPRVGLGGEVRHFASLAQR